MVLFLAGYAAVTLKVDQPNFNRAWNEKMAGARVIVKRLQCLQDQATAWVDVQVDTTSHKAPGLLTNYCAIWDVKPLI